MIFVGSICAFLSKGLGDKRNELYQVKKTFFLPSVNFGQAPLLPPKLSNYCLGWRLKNFPIDFFFAPGGRSVCLSFEGN